jgi:hypothetical protein
MRNVLASATEAEAVALFHNAHAGVPLQTTLIEMSHPQGPTPIQTDNACNAGIANEIVKEISSKAIDMCFYWIRDRIHKCQSRVHWRRGIDNLVDYFTKHHSPAYHCLMCSRYLLQMQKT